MAAGNPIVLPESIDTCLDNPLSRTLCFSPETKNVLVRDGEFQTRPGLNPLGQNFGEVVLGSYWLRDLLDTAQIIIATSTKWRKFNNASQTWTDITGGVPLNQSSRPTIFTYFFQGGAQYVIGVADPSVTKEYNIVNAAYNDYIGAPIARTCCTVANRVMFGAIKIAGTLFPQTVQWTAAGDRTVFPALARNDLVDTNDHIIVLKNLGRRAAVILREHSQWVALSQPGSDAQAFEFVLLDNQPGPIGPAAADHGPGGMQIVYLAIDGNLYSFDGVKATIIKDTQKYILGRLNPDTRMLTTVKYLPLRQEIWCAVALDMDIHPHHVLAYSYKTRTVSLHKFAVGITHLGVFHAELNTATNNLPDIPTDQLPNIPTDQLGVSSRGQTGLVGTTEQVFSLEGQLDAGFDIDNDWRVVLPVLPRQEYEFDGVEATFEPTTGQGLTVSVLWGQTYDSLTETVLGAIYPTLVGEARRPPMGETMSVRRNDDETIRARIIVVRFSGPGSFFMRRCEIHAWPHSILA